MENEGGSCGIKEWKHNFWENSSHSYGKIQELWDNCGIVESQLVG